MSYTIKETSNMLNIPPTTIRYYDKEGLLPYIERRPSGYRSFSDSDIEMLRLIECLKATGMPIKDIKQFVEWVKLGDASLRERYEMFLERKRAVEIQMESLQKTMELISYKCNYYKDALDASSKRT